MLKFLRLKILLILGRVNPNLKYYLFFKVSKFIFFFEVCNKKRINFVYQYIFKSEYQIRGTFWYRQDGELVSKHVET